MSERISSNNKSNDREIFVGFLTESCTDLPLQSFRTECRNASNNATMLVIIVSEQLKGGIEGVQFGSGIQGELEKKSRLNRKRELVKR